MNHLGFLILHFSIFYFFAGPFPDSWSSSTFTKMLAIGEDSGSNIFIDSISFPGNLDDMFLSTSLKSTVPFLNSINHH